MDNREKYDKLKELENRIFELKLLQKYFIRFLDVKPFSVMVTTEILGAMTATPFNNMNSRHDTYIAAGSQTKEDAQAILQFIDDRIKGLEKEFNEL